MEITDPRQLSGAGLRADRPPGPGRRGVRRAGARSALPTVRQLAGDLQLNRNTVARAYKQLEDRGVILTAGSKGTFVRAEGSRECGNQSERRAQRAVHVAALSRPLEPRRDHQPSTALRAAQPRVRAMTEWIDFVVYASQLLLFWVFLPQQGRSFTPPMSPDLDPSSVAAHSGLVERLERIRWFISTPLTPTPQPVWRCCFC